MPSPARVLYRIRLTVDLYEMLTFDEICVRCPGLVRETLKARLARGARDLHALRAPPASRQVIARRTRPGGPA